MKPHYRCSGRSPSPYCTGGRATFLNIQLQSTLIGAKVWVIDLTCSLNIKMKEVLADNPQDKFEDDHSPTDDYLSEKEPAGLPVRIVAAAALILLPLIYFYQD